MIYKYLWKCKINPEILPLSGPLPRVISRRSFSGRSLSRDDSRSFSAAERRHKFSDPAARLSRKKNTNKAYNWGLLKSLTILQNWTNQKRNNTYLEHKLQISSARHVLDFRLGRLLDAEVRPSWFPCRLLHASMELKRPCPFSHFARATCVLLDQSLIFSCQLLVCVSCYYLVLPPWLSAWLPRGHSFRAFQASLRLRALFAPSRFSPFPNALGVPFPLWLRVPFPP